MTGYLLYITMYARRNKMDDYKRRLEERLLNGQTGGLDMYSYRYREPKVPEQPLEPKDNGGEE